MKVSEIVEDLLRIALILVSFLFMVSIIVNGNTNNMPTKVISEEIIEETTVAQRVQKDILQRWWILPDFNPPYPEWKIPDNPYILEIEEVAKCYDFVDDLDCLIYAMISCESNFDPTIKSSAGCAGLMQVSPYWHSDRAAKLGVEDLWDPYGNILTATDFLEDLYYNYANRNIELAVMMYNMNFADAKRIYNSGRLSSYAIDVFAIFNELKGG